MNQVPVRRKEFHFIKWWEILLAIFVAHFKWVIIRWRWHFTCRNILFLRIKCHSKEGKLFRIFFKTSKNPPWKPMLPKASICGGVGFLFDTNTNVMMEWLWHMYISTDRWSRFVTVSPARPQHWWAKKAQLKVGISHSRCIAQRPPPTPASSYWRFILPLHVWILQWYPGCLKSFSLRLPLQVHIWLSRS